MMLDITKQISNYNFSSRNGIEIKYIVIHDTGNLTDSAAGNANYFSQGRQASAHYFVDDNSIYQLVEDNNASWHCGDGAGKYGITNHNSIGVEMCRVNGNVTPATEANTVELIKYLIKKYNVILDDVRRHYDASRKNCPSSFSANNWARWDSFKQKLTGGVNMQQEVSDWAKEAQKFVIDNKISDGARPKDNMTREETWTMLHRFAKAIK